ncbi:hypothetical protein [Sporosarcina sp. FSL K6-3457]|uniref:hypothetical protein n=1 Tax=Sporosarcina sp. FSL K6-3457 TaxID=2978204 RepID=UPI0030F6FBB2
MKQFMYGLVFYIFLVLPPVANVMESIMIIHMHMQMPLLVVTGFLMAKFFQQKFPGFFDKWNGNGVPGIVLFSIIWLYWMMPRTMDEALTVQNVELFKFISLPFLAGIPLRDSWKKISLLLKKIFFISFTVLFLGMGMLYIMAPIQLCNNYLLIEQIILGWGFLTTSFVMIIYLFYFRFTDQSPQEL